MNRGWISRSTLLTLGLVLIVAFGLLMTGCGSKPDVETEPETEAEDQGQVEEIPPTIQGEETDTIEDTMPDYASMDPSEYGVEDVYFAFDQYDLDNEAMGILSRNARALREANVLVLVSGHCDERGTIEYNLALGEKRAKAVRDYLVSLGVPARNLRVTSYGESKPFARGHTEDAWAMNRRAHFERP